MNPLSERFAETLHQRSLLQPGQHVLVACSGGLDSVVLLHLVRFAAPRDVRVSVAHFDHRMRADSGADASWVRGLSRAWEIPAEFCTAQVGLASEAEARSARYAFLEDAARRLNAGAIATAHHADDQSETVLFRLLRGSGLDGLSAIPDRRGSIVRPLLTFWKSELEAYARAHGLAWREDASNRDPRFARNRIRHELLPALETAAPGTREKLADIANHAGRLRRAWDGLLAQLEHAAVTAQDSARIELARPVLLEYHPDLRARLLRRWLGRLGQAPGRAGTGAIEAFISAGVSGTGIHIKGSLRAEREFDTIRLLRADATKATDQPLWITGAAPGSGEATIGGARYNIRWSVSPARDGNDLVALDPAAVRFPLALRAWRPGDRIRLPIGTKKLKKLFGERKIGGRNRRTAAVLVDPDGSVLWVRGLAQSVAARPEPGAPAFCITVRDAEPD